MNARGQDYPAGHCAAAMIIVILSDLSLVLMLPPHPWNNNFCFYHEKLENALTHKHKPCFFYF